MDVTLPNGLVVYGVPEGISKKDLAEKLIRNNIATADDLGFDPFEDERTVSGQAFETAKGIGRGFANAFLSAGEGLAELADAGTNAIGLEELIDSGDENDLVRAAREGRAAVDEAMGADLAYRDQWLTKFGEGVGSFASFFTPAGAIRVASLAGKGLSATKAAKVAELAGAGTLAVGTGAGDQAQRIQAARDSGLDVSQDEEDLALLLGGGVGLSEILTPAKLLKRLRGLEAGGKLPSGIKERLSSALRTGSLEGIQEVAASIAQDGIEQGVYNEALEIGGGNLFDDFTIGGAVGAGADLLLNAVAGRRNKKAFESAQEAEGKLREDLQDAQDFRQQALAGDLAAQANIDAQAAADRQAANEARRRAGESPVDPSQIAPPTGRALTSKLKTPSRIITLTAPNGESFQAEEKFRVRDRGKPTETVTAYVEAPGGGEVITSVNGVPQLSGFQITTVAQPTEGIQRRYPKQPMLAYAQSIRQAMGDNFPSADNTFTVKLPEDFGGEGVSTTQLDAQGVPVFTVQDSNGQQYGVPLQNSEDAFALAGFLNDEMINDNVFSAGDAVITSSPESYDADQESSLQAYNFAANHPDSNTYTSVAVDSAAETTQDRGFDETADVKVLMQNRVGPSKMTASQRINAKRLRKGLPVTNTFTIEEVRSVLKEDQLYNLSDTRINGLPETETYRAGLSKNNNPIVKSSAGEILQGRPLTTLEKDAAIKANPKKKPPKLVKFKTEADARVYANQLNNRTGKAAVEKGVMRNVDANFQEMEQLLKAKNITSKVGSPEIKYLASRILGKKTIKSVNDLSLAESRLLYQKLRSLPRFDKPTKLPTFKLPKYTGAQFRAASKTLQETPDAGEVVLANATGINPTTQQGAAALSDLRADLAKQGVQAAPTVEAEPVVEQEAEVLALPAPAVNVDRLRKAIAKAMKGFGLEDVGLNLDYALRTAVRDADGNLVYGIRPRREGDIDSMVLGGEAGSGLFVKSDEVDPEGRAEAYYDPDLNTIFLSIDRVMADPSMTEAQIEAALLEILDHEMIHAMRKLDLFTNKEFNLLSRAAANKRMPDGRTFLKWAQDNYSDLSPVAQVEESVAELVRGVRKDPKLLQGKPRSLVERIARFFRNMVSALKGEKFNTFSEVIGAIESGEIGGRQRGQIRTLVQTEKALSRELKAGQQRGPVATTGDEAEAPVPTATGQTIADFDEAAAVSVDEDQAEAPAFSRRPVERGGIEGNVSTRYPTGAKRTEDPLDDLLVNDYQTFVNDKTVFNKNMELIKDSKLYPILQKATNLRTNEQKAEAFVEAVKSNLLNLFDRVPAETRENSKVWYKGANALVRRFAERHGISMEQASAVAANLSPQKDWYQNASLAERTIDVYFNQANQPFTQEMKDRAEELFFHKGISAKAQAKNREMLELIGSSTLSEVLRKFNEPGLGDTLAAMWIRTFDQTYHDPSYRIVSPDGRLLDYAKNADGSNSKVAWGSLVEIAKAVRALQNPDIDAISESLGSANKVRNFYNNIFDPDSDLGFVTIDTHAVAAGLLKPLGGSAFEVSHNFGTKGSSSKITGLNGVYSLYEEAYRRAANERGVLPREMQSITWEAVRGLFRPEYKSQQSNVDVVDNIWKQYNKKLITLDQAREAVYEHAQDITPPDWERSSGGISEGDEATTYERKLPDSGVSRPRSESATGRGRGSNAARPLQTEDVALPFDLPESQKRRKTIGQSEVDRVVEDNLEVAENRPAGTVPRFNPGADPYSQAVAANPDKGQELTPSEMPSFSRANAPEVSPTAQAALDNVVADLPTNTPGQTYLNVLDQGPIRKALTRFKQKAVNRYAQLENYQGVFGDLLADSSSMAAALMADRANAITAAALQYGVPVYTGGMTKIVDFEHTNSRGETKKIGGLIDLMSMLYTKEHGSLEQLAQAYSIAKRAERLRSKGIDVPGTPADHAANIATAESFLDENGNSIIKDWYDAWQDYNGYTVQFLQDTGVVDPETAEMWRDQSDYIPFYRQVEGAETPNAPNIFGGLTGSADLKAIKGSEKEINVPMLEAISMNLNAAISMGMKNVAQQRIVRDMRNIGLAREVKPGQRTAGEAVVTFKVNGNRRNFIIDDPLIYESLTVEPAGGVEQKAAKIAGFPARFLREMVTREPGFVIANMLRDSLSAFVTSGSSFIPVVDTFFGYAEGMEKLERTGVVGGYDYKNDPENIGEYAGKILQRKNKNVDQRGLLAKTFGRAWDFMGQATTRSDAATRNAVYNDVLARTGNEAEASFQAMEVLNFGRRGSSPVMRLVTATIPFLNARIQGLDVLVRAGAGKNTANRELSRGQAAASFLARGGLIAASTAIYYTMVSDDDQYKEQTEEIKDNYWIIPTPSGVPGRVPIPFEVGLLFKTLPERIIDSYNEGTTTREAQQSLQRAVFGTLGVQLPQAITPIIEAYMNHDLYTGRPVTPVFIEGNLDPQFQELASTTEVAKNMSKVLGISPIKLDHLMKGYGGTLGVYLLGAVDYGLRDSRLQGDNRSVLAGKDVSQYPIVRRFFGSEFGGGAKEDFYEMWDYIKRVEQTAKNLYESGRTEELENYLVNKRQFLGMRKQLQPTANLLADLRKQRRAILKADLSAAEKQEYMKLINEQEQYYLQIVPTLEKYIQLPSLTESVADRLSSLL